jgi:hypothetical protein
VRRQTVVLGVSLSTRSHDIVDTKSLERFEQKTLVQGRNAR